MKNEEKIYTDLSMEDIVEFTVLKLELRKLKAQQNSIEYEIEDIEKNISDFEIKHIKNN